MWSIEIASDEIQCTFFPDSWDIISMLPLIPFIYVILLASTRPSYDILLRPNVAL